MNAAFDMAPVTHALQTARADVIVLNDFAYVQGGGTKVAIASAVALAQRGHRVLFFAAVGPVCPELAGSGVEVCCLDQVEPLSEGPKGALRPLWNREAARRLDQLLDDFSPSCTIVHVHGWMKALSSSVVRAVGARGFRIVGTLHDYTAVCPNGGLFNYRTEKPCSLTPAGVRCVATNCDSRSYGHKVWRLARHAIQQCAGGFDRPFARYVCVSDLNRELHRGRLPTGSRMEAIRNPIDVAPTPPVDAARNSAFLFVGRLSPEKGPVLFARAAAAAAVPAVLVGDGPLGDAIRAAAPAAEITGWQPAEDVQRRMRGARALVFSSLWPEAQGLTVWEAAALGVPAIVSDACAAREAVQDGETGLLFRSGDPADLRRQIERCRNDDLVAHMGRTAHARFWADPPTVAAHADALTALYAQVLQEGPVNG